VTAWRGVVLHPGAMVALHVRDTAMTAPGRPADRHSLLDSAAHPL
jgi:hypothetical protein